MPLKRLTQWIQSLNPYDPNTLARDGLKPIQLEEASIKSKTARFMVVVFLAFLVWATLAPIDAGVLVPGTVVVKGNRKAVQHPTGGEVQLIKVTEGAHVKQGEVLIRINPLSIEAALSAAELEYIGAFTSLSRMLAERSHRPAIEWIGPLKDYAGDPRLAQAIRLQTEVFKSRTAELQGQQKIINEQIVGKEAELKGLGQALQELRHQNTMLEQEARETMALAAEGFVPRNQAYAVERGRSSLAASIGNTLAQQASSQSGLAGLRLQLIQLLSAYHKDLDTQISETQKNQDALASKVASLRHDRGLVDIRAPADGVVVGLKVHTVGGVIAGSQVLMEIVPISERLVVDAQVPSIYIDKVRVGMDVDLRFSAFNMVTTPVIPGKVRQVGADLLTPSSQAPTLDAGQQGSYYLAQIETTQDHRKLLGDQTIQPGMPVEVIIKSGERNFLSYLMKPIGDRFARAFKGD